MMIEPTTKTCRMAVSARNIALTCACGASMVSASASAKERKRNSRAGMNGVREVRRSTTRRLIQALNVEPGRPAVHWKPSSTRFPPLRTT